MASDATNNPMSPWLERVWLERYLERGLSPEETQSFEAYMLDKPELLAAVESDTDLRDGLVLPGIAIDAAPAAPDAATPIAAATAAKRRGPGAWMPMAATLVLGFALGLLLQGLPGVQEQAGDVIASPTRVVFDTMRGAELEPRIEPGSPGTDAMLIEVGMPPAATDITVRIGDGPELPLVLSPDGFVSFVTADSSARAASISYHLEGKPVRREIAFPLTNER